MQHPHWHLIQYDITDKKRLARLHRFLKSSAFALQESVFAWYGTEDELHELQHQLKKIISRKTDDVRGYRCNRHFYIFGHNPFVQDIYFDGLPPHKTYPPLEYEECIEQFIAALKQEAQHAVDHLL